MVSFPEMVRTTSGLGEARYALGDRLVDRYLEFVAGRARPNTLRVTHGVRVARTDRCPWNLTSLSLSRRVSWTDSFTDTTLS